MGSTRLPGKVLEPIGDRPLVRWAIDATRAVRGVDAIVLATTTDPTDDPLVTAVEATGVAAHRGPVLDVLTRTWEAVAPLEPEVVIRVTADNPFMDADVIGTQLRCLLEGDLDYVGTAGWPLGIAAEIARAGALQLAFEEAPEPAEREHVMPFLYARPDRFRVGELAVDRPIPNGRFTVDTAEDLAFARAIAARLELGERPTVERLRGILLAAPELRAINRDVRQKGWQEAEAL
jgi:spore coat polysaccharide biosynthesis protein SpsF (cytidylyltransferase family)